ncbi:MAG: mammalian cell entry protein [Nocardia sp.]|uniref:MCE family protein n=1 Tax=Nocardia sp. TaxID=1821 RepID=UPI0026283FE3|nr:MCE family protein [Nocardia sp.]MCU1647691.1 mammalian cell entry protein [Nocardia sp.]
MTSRTRLLLPLLISVTAISGCGITVEDLPLPRPGVGANSYSIHAIFGNALNLPASAHVKIGGSDVGEVTAISTRNYIADVEMSIRGDVQVPANATAELRQATPLGDVYVAISLPPRTPDQQLLHAGDTIQQQNTSAGASVEDLLLSVATLVNGGALNRLANISTELDSMVAGRGPVLAHLITEMTSATTALNQRSDQLDGFLGATGGLLAQFNQRKAELSAVADTVPAMISAIADDNRKIGDLLGKIATTGAALDDFAKTSATDLSTLLDSTEKLTSSLARMGDNFAGTLDALHEVTPKLLTTMRGNAMAFYGTANYLGIGALYDPGSKFPDGSDANAFTGSLLDVLQRVYNRVTGGQR